MVSRCTSPAAVPAALRLTGPSSLLPRARRPPCQGSPRRRRCRRARAAQDPLTGRVAAFMQFQEADLYDEGSLTRKELARIPEIASNPFGDRIHLVCRFGEDDRIGFKVRGPRPAQGGQLAAAPHSFLRDCLLLPRPPGLCHVPEHPLHPRLPRAEDEGWAPRPASSLVAMSAPPLTLSSQRSSRCTTSTRTGASGGGTCC